MATLIEQERKLEVFARDVEAQHLANVATQQRLDAALLQCQRDAEAAAAAIAASATRVNDADLTGNTSSMPQEANAAAASGTLERPSSGAAASRLRRSLTNSLFKTK